MGVDVGCGFSPIVRPVAVSVELRVVETSAQVAEAVAEMLAEAARAASSIALAGGTTPRDAYVLAARAEPSWGGAEIWLGDERLVPDDDPRSNAKLVRDALLRGLATQPVTHLVRTELPAEDAAAAYARELEGVRLDLVLLGLGADGHTASLFPNAPSLDERERLVVAAQPGLAPWVERVTMTPRALGSAAHVVFLAAGREKAQAARRAFSEPPSAAVPASLVRSLDGRTTAILDREAAAELG